MLMDPMNTKRTDDTTTTKQNKTKWHAHWCDVIYSTNTKGLLSSMAFIPGWWLGAETMEGIYGMIWLVENDNKFYYTQLLLVM